MKNECIYKVVSYSIDNLTRNLKNNNLKVNNLEKIDEYIYHISIHPLYEKKLLEIYKDAELIHCSGLFFILKRRLIQKITLISILLSFIYFIYLNNLIYKINIYGNNLRINDEIRLVLNENKINENEKKPNKNSLKDIKKIILNKYDEIENVDIEIKGSIFNLRYYLKEKENNHTQIIGKYVAIKDGIIAYASIEKGNYLCYSNQYVKKGDILIDDYLYINDKKIYVGAYGKVYAYTWSIIELTLNSKGYDDAEVYSKMISDARYKISIEFEEFEKIVKENVLSFNIQNNRAYMKIHYTVFENIAEIFN